MKFAKPAMSPADLRARWEERGLQVPNPNEADHYLRYIGYYRLSAYAVPLQVEGSTLTARLDKPFRHDVCFADILNLYRFDRELRMLFMDAVERIEVGIRAVIVDEMCTLHGPHWYLDPAHFKQKGRFKHNKLIQKIEKGLHIYNSPNPPNKAHHEVFINHYYKTYTAPYLPPAWMIAETLTLGTCSLIFEHICPTADRKRIAKHFQTDEQVLKNWLHALTYLRNLCAHHSRLWNRAFVIKPVIAQRHSSFLKSNDYCYAVAVVVEDLLRKVAPDTNWAGRLQNLLKGHPYVNPEAMGFPLGWDQEPFWNLT